MPPPRPPPPPRRSSIRPAPPRPRHFIVGRDSRSARFYSLGVHFPHGPGARTAAWLRAAARASPAPDRFRGRSRARGARRHTRQTLDQEGLEAAGVRARRADDGSDHSGGRGHARQGGSALLEGHAARPERSVRPLGRGRVRLPESRAGGRCAPARLERQGRLRRHGVPVRSVPACSEARRCPGGGRARRRRDRHGDRPRRLPLRPLRKGLRRDRQGEGSLWRRAPEGDPGDRRARDVRQRAPGVAARHGRRRRLHQDLDREGEPGGDAAR